MDLSLRASSDSSFEEEENAGEDLATVEAYRTKLQAYSWTQKEEDLEPVGLMKDTADQLAKESFGDDGDECLIPEEWKEPEDQIDVLEFLGIARAPSIAKPRDWE